MVDELRPMVMDVVDATPSNIAMEQGTVGMFYSAMQAKAASEKLGVACHKEACQHLLPVLRKAMLAPRM